MCVYIYIYIYIYMCMPPSIAPLRATSGETLEMSLRSCDK